MCQGLSALGTKMYQGLPAPVAKAYTFRPRPEREKGNAWTFYRDTGFIQNVGPVKLCSDAERGYGGDGRGGLGVKLIE